jgi:hypothetical protein
MDQQKKVCVICSIEVLWFFFAVLHIFSNAVCVIFYQYHSLDSDLTTIVNVVQIYM